MSLESVKSLVRRVFEDRQFKEQMVSNPEGTLARFELTSEEKEAIRRIHGQLGLVSGHSGELAAIQKPVIDWWSAPTSGELAAIQKPVIDWWSAPPR